MKKLTAIMCVILVFTTTTIPVYAEDEIYIEPGQNVSENMESEIVESENIESENMESENVESENMESENMESEKMVSENMESENIDSENMESEKIESENMVPVDESEDAGEYGIALLAEETSVVCGDFMISGDDLSENTDYSYSNNELTISSSKAITVSTPGKSADNPTTADRIVVVSADGADITLSGVYIRCRSYAAFEIKSDAGKVTVTLDGDNTLTSGGGNAGLQNNEVPLIIKENPGASGSLTANGDGGGAGIGGGIGQNGSNITIASGTITATGGSSGGAGIGGGASGGSGSNITIASGTITATGGSSGGAGIGGGASGGSGSNITITGGIVKAESNYGAAGIGGGAGGGDGTNITIEISSGEKVEAISKQGGAGIGGGGAGIGGGNGTNIKITVNGSGEVIAKNNLAGGAGIGGGGFAKGNNGTGIEIIVNDTGKVTATGGINGGAGIGGGAGGNGGAEGANNGIAINVNGSGTVEATGNRSGAGIGGGGISNGVCGNGENITITGSGKVIAKGIDDRTTPNAAGAGIGGGAAGNYDAGSGKNIKIDLSGGEVIAECSNGTSAGIGGGGAQNGKCGNGEDITINGSGTVTATGGSVGANGGAGIGGAGGGTCGSSDRITISGSGTVEATGGTSGAGIGGGGGYDGWTQKASVGNGGEITIDENFNGTVTASGNTGIGGESSTIKINGSGTVTATGNTGIGGTESTVEIKGTSETSFPWVETSKIVSTNGNGDYQGIVFDRNYKEHYGEDITDETVKAVRQEHKPDGVVYGNVDLSELDKAYVLESGKTLVVKGELTTNYNLTLANGSTLYLEEGAKLDNYEAVNGYDVKSTDENRSRILHESQSDHEVNGTICKICGSPVPHQWSKDWSSDDDCHWHECTAEDCSVIPDPNIKCTITKNSEKDGYGEHVFGEPEKDGTDGKLYLICSVCGYKKLYVTTIQLIKKDDKGEALKDAEFRLCSDPDCQIPVAGNSTAMSDENGKISFTEGIESGKTYYIKETKAPDGYMVSEKVFEAVVDVDGKVTYSVVGLEGNVTVPNGIPECVNTKINPDPVQIIKVDGEGKALTGAKFKLYSDENCTETKQVGAEVTAAETTIDGETKAVASFTVGIELDTTYYIKETQAPSGYTASDKVYKAVVGTDGKVTYSVVDSKGNVTVPNGIPECVNTKINPDPVQIIKVDGEGKALTGAKFKLYSDENCTETKQVGAEVTAAETTIDGETKAVASFTVGIEPGKTYYIKETQAPSGYTASDKVYKAVVGTDGKVTYSVVDPEGNVTVPNGIPECVNTKINPDPIQIYKVDGGGEALAGAKFKLYSDAGCAETARVGEEVTAAETAIGDETKAVASFTVGIEVGKTYYIKETEAPDGYTASDKVYKAVVGADGKVTYSIVDSKGNIITDLDGIPECVNAKIIPDPAKIIVEDGETGAPLAGAEFGIYSDKQCTEANRIAVGSTKIDTDSESDTYNKAVVSFKTELGRAYCIIELDTTYYIKETQAPEGYIASEEVYKVVVGIDGKVTYGTVGSEETKETVPVCKNYKIIPGAAKIIKVDGETGTPLAGAEFGIYSDEECTEANRIAVGTTAIDTDSASDTCNKAVVSFATERNRTYYIKEIKAPNGYNVSGVVYKAVVDADGKVTYGTAGSETTLETVPVCKNYAVKITYNPPSITKVEETGDPIVLSPKTGDTGEAGAAGIAILSGIVCAAFLVGVILKKKRKKELFQ